MDKGFSLEEKRQLQLKELPILDELDRLCRAHGLKYFLTAGSLLGAVRHQGFIPWDDDIDVAMPRKDFNALQKIAERELKDGFFFQSEKSEKKYPFLFAKIRRDGTKVTEDALRGLDIHDGCYIDIFPLDKCPGGERRAKHFFKLQELILTAMLAKSGGAECGYERLGGRLAFKLCRAMPRPILRFIRRCGRFYYSTLSRSGRLTTLGGSYGYPKETYPKEWFDGEIKLRFEDRELPCPARYDDILTSMYGDYMTPPSENEKHGHFIKEEE